MNTQSGLKVQKNTRQRLIVIALIVVLVSVLGLMTGVAMFTNQVYITDGMTTIKVLTADDDVKEILEKNGYKIGKDDKIEFSGFKDNVGEIKILRAFDVSLKVGKSEVTVPIADGTVADVIEKSGMTVDDDDLINIGFLEKVSPQTQIVVDQVVCTETIDETPIPHSVTEVKTANLKKGTTAVVTEGVDGIKTITTRKVYVNGEVKEAVVLNEAVTREPVAEVINVGTAVKTPISQAAPASLQLDANGVPLDYAKVITGKSAAYSARAGAKTASGRTAKVGTVAVNPKVIPYGTKLYIKSNDSKDVYGYAIAADTGTALLDGRIVVDLFFDSYEASCQWGIHNVSIYVLN
ncbi:MAG: G5 domain-containing protein [Oscillospiraceae bacterium]